jgi:hypothetical protein
VFPLTLTIKGPEDWTQLNILLDANPQAERGAIRFPMLFSVLAESEDHCPTLVSENERKFFASDIDLGHTVVPSPRLFDLQ